jgi:hypothetical protein
VNRLGALVAAASLAALAATGCGAKLPEISALEWRLEKRPLGAGPDYESLSVFAAIKDEDGLDNIAEIWIVEDDASYAWKLSDSDWIKAKEGADTWFGASALAGPELAALPRGSYRMLVVDSGGQRVEREFRVSGSFPPRAAPTVSLSGAALSIGSSWPETLVLAFDGAGALLASVPSRPKSSTLEALFGQETAAKAAELCAYGYDPSLRMGSFSKRTKAR